MLRGESALRAITWVLWSTGLGATCLFREGTLAVLLLDYYVRSGVIKLLLSACSTLWERLPARGYLRANALDRLSSGMCPIFPHWRSGRHEPRAKPSQVGDTFAVRAPWLLNPRLRYLNKIQVLAGTIPSDVSRTVHSSCCTDGPMVQCQTNMKLNLLSEQSTAVLAFAVSV